MQKLTLLLLAISIFQPSLAAQNLNIPTRLLAQNTPKHGDFSEIVQYKGNFEDVDFGHGMPPKLLKYNDSCHKYIYKDKRLEKMSLYKNANKDQVLVQFDFEYGTEKLQKITGYQFKLTDGTWGLAPFQTIQLDYKKEVLVAETVKDEKGEIQEQYDYLPGKQTGQFPLIEYTHTAYKDGKPDKETRNVLQYDDKGLAFYCSLMGKDTVYSIILTWYKPNEGIQRIFDGKTRITNMLAVYYDAYGNPVMTISETHIPGAGIKKNVSYAEIKYVPNSILSPTNKEEPENTIIATSVSDSSITPIYWADDASVIEAPHQKIDPEKVFEAYEVDLKPVFQGGDADYFQFIQTNLQYPAAAKSKNIQGMVVVSFIIEKDGSLSNIEIKRDIGSGCGTEVVRVLQQMPKWAPGQFQGQQVRVRETKPIRFKL